MGIDPNFQTVSLGASAYKAQAIIAPRRGIRPVTTIVYVWRGTRRVRSGRGVALRVYTQVLGVVLILVGILAGVGNGLFLGILNTE